MFACNNILFYCKGYIYGHQEDLEKDHVILNVESLMELVTQTMLETAYNLQIPRVHAIQKGRPKKECCCQLFNLLNQKHLNMLQLIVKGTNEI